MRIGRISDKAFQDVVVDGMNIYGKDVWDKMMRGEVVDVKTFPGHVAFIESDVAKPVEVNSGNILELLQGFAAILEENNVPKHDRWVVMYIWYGRVHDPRRHIKRRLDKKRNPFTWNFRHKERGKR